MVFDLVQGFAPVCQCLGVLGVILAPAVAATVCILVDELYLKPLNEDSPNE